MDKAWKSQIVFRIKQPNRSFYFAAFCLFGALLYWPFESYLDVFLLKDGQAINQFISPDLNAWWMRGEIITLFASMGIYSLMVTRRYNQVLDQFKTNSAALQHVDSVEMVHETKSLSEFFSFKSGRGNSSHEE